MREGDGCIACAVAGVGVDICVGCVTGPEHLIIVLKRLDNVIVTLVGKSGSWCWHGCNVVEQFAELFLQVVDGGGGDGEGNIDDLSCDSRY